MEEEITAEEFVDIMHLRNAVIHRYEYPEYIEANDRLAKELNGRKFYRLKREDRFEVTPFIEKAFLSMVTGYSKKNDIPMRCVSINDVIKRKNGHKPYDYRADRQLGDGFMQIIKCWFNIDVKVTDQLDFIGPISPESGRAFGVDNYEEREKYKEKYHISSNAKKSFFILTRPDFSKMVVVRAKAIYEHIDELLELNSECIRIRDIEQVLEEHKDYEKVI